MQFASFFESTIRPALEMLAPKIIVEIGTGEGLMLRSLIDVAERYDSLIHTVDPNPGSAATELANRHADRVVLHRERSLEVLPRLQRIDVAFIDGDHNWYTVYHELTELRRIASMQDFFPLVILHDIGWPYGRRDMYHDPSKIPDESRHPYRKQGIVPGESGLVERGGINDAYCNAILEGGSRNGVRTAVEDFLSSSGLPLRFIAIEGGHGIGILADQRMIEGSSSFAGWLSHLSPSDFLQAHVESIEKFRLSDLIAMNKLRQQLSALDNTVSIQRKHIEELIQKRINLEQKAKQGEASKIRAQSLERELQSLLRELDSARASLQFSVTLLEKSSVREKFFQSKVLFLQKKMKDTVEHMMCTRSWRITAPLRRIGRILSALRRKHVPVTQNQNQLALESYGFFPSGDYAGWLLKHDPSVRSPLLVRQALLSHENPLISVIVCVRNFDEVLLRKSLNSVVEQLYTHWQLVIVDDGSPHGILKSIVRDYQYFFPDKVLYAECGEGNSAENVGVSTATGAYVSFLHPHDEYHRHALLEIASAFSDSTVDAVYTDHDFLNSNGGRERPTFKPCWSPESLLSSQYVGSSIFFSVTVLRHLLQTLPCDSDIDFLYALLLEFSHQERTVLHLPVVLHHRRVFEHLSPMRTRIERHRCSLLRHLERRKCPSHVNCHSQAQENVDGSFTITRSPDPTPLVTIIIPTKDRVDLLRRCVSSIKATCGYSHYRILVIDNGSTDPETLEYLLQSSFQTLRIETNSFNFAHINNVAASHAESELLLFLNNDTEGIEEGWLATLVADMQLSEKIGVVAPRLRYGTQVSGMSIQHAGMRLGRHLSSLVRFPWPTNEGWQDWNLVLHNCSAVSGACLLTKKSLFRDVGGFDEEHLAVDFCDSDYCLKLLGKGYRIVCDASVTLLHHESATRGNNGGNGATLNPAEADSFRKRWHSVIDADPYYSPNLSFRTEGYELAFPPRDSSPRSVTSKFPSGTA